MFYIPYIVAEIPLNILCKYLGPGWFLPITTVLFGVCSLATAWVQTVEQMMGVRFLLGLFEAGMLPGITYYMSRWYRRSELTFRLSMYIVSSALAGAFGGLLASAILNHEQIAGATDWPMIFFVEGLIKIGLGLLGFVTLTDRPASAERLNQKEKELAENRVRSERVGQAKVLDKMDKTKLRHGITNPVTWVLSGVFFCSNNTVHGLAFFAPTVVQTIFPGSSTVQQQLYTVPPCVVGAFFTLLLPLISWRVDRRQIFMIMVAILPMTGYIMFLATDSSQVFVRYGGTLFIASTIFVYGVFPNAQISANVVSDTARSSDIGWSVMIENFGGLVATWSFLPFDGPDYPIGNELNFATLSCILILNAGLLFWMTRDNAIRDERQETAERKLQNMTEQEAEDLDWKHPRFRWRP